jgi:hypothetical protein
VPLPYQLARGERRFKSFFGGLDTLDNKDEITFAQVGTTLKVSAKKQNKDFSSPALCKAMFDIYLGCPPARPRPAPPAPRRAPPRAGPRRAGSVSRGA